MSENNLPDSLVTEILEDIYNVTNNMVQQDGFGQSFWTFLSDLNLEPRLLLFNSAYIQNHTVGGLFFPFESWDKPQNTFYGQVCLGKNLREYFRTHKNKNLPKYMSPHGLKLQNLRLGKPPYIVAEGYKSAVALYYLGFSCIGVPGCTSVTHIKKQNDSITWPEYIRGIFLDSDLYRNIGVCRELVKAGVFFGSSVFTWGNGLAFYLNYHEKGFFTGSKQGVNEFLKNILLYAGVDHPESGLKWCTNKGFVNFFSSLDEQQKNSTIKTMKLTLY